MGWNAGAVHSNLRDCRGQCRCRECSHPCLHRHVVEGQVNHNEVKSTHHHREQHNSEQHERTVHRRLLRVDAHVHKERESERCSLRCIRTPSLSLTHTHSVCTIMTCNTHIKQ